MAEIVTGELCTLPPTPGEASPLGSVRDNFKAFAARATPYGVPLLVSSLLAMLAIREILHDAGQPGMPLDDSYIHFVYARRFAEGHPFTFSPGDGYSSGATSFVWPLVLSPFWLIGFRGLKLVWIVWGLGTLLHAAVAVETKRLAEGLAGRAAGIGAGAMCLLFGAFAWFAWSGMETMALAWAMTRTARLASEWIETPSAERTRRGAIGLGIMAAITPLVRPEGALMALAAAAALVAYPRASKNREEAIRVRLPALLPIGGIALLPLLNLALVGHARSTTTMVKWAVGNPYYPRLRLWQFISGNVKMLFEDLLSGGPYTAIFVPEYSHWVFLAGALALIPAGLRHARLPRALLVAVLAVGTLIPCTFITILWNRVRYIYPFAPGWFVLVACLGGELAAIVAWLTKREAAWVPALVTGIYAGALGTKLTWAINDLANSSRAITQQQVALGVWAADNLPRDARIGLNDTGAIAYFSERRTFDVVGLTTEGEAPYWVAGAGSRYEHYERLGKDALPTHFIVYPQWFAMPAVLGDRLHDATVTEQSILGGATKVAYEAEWSGLGLGDRPVLKDRESAIVDALDVADLVSESAHGYEVGPTSENENQVSTSWNDDGAEVTDGGRHKRYADRFNLDFGGTKQPVFVARLAAEQDAVLELLIDSRPVATVLVPKSAWAEVELPLPPELSAGNKRVELKSTPPATFSSMHYWLFAD